MNCKYTRAFNMGLIVPKTIVELAMDHIQALNQAYAGYGLYHTSDDHVLIVDDRGQRYNLDGETGDVYSASFVDKWVWNDKPLLQGKYSLRAQDYSFMVVYINRGIEHRLTRGQHTMMALGYDLPGFNRALTSGVDVADIVVNHKNNCGYDNHPSNLEWVSQRDNGLHGEYVKKLAELHPDDQGNDKLFRNVSKRYLNVGVQAYSLRFALTLFKILKGNVPAFEKIMSQLGSIIDIDYLIADPNTMPEVKTACQTFKTNPGFVTKPDIVDKFIDVFEHFKDIKIIF